MKIKIFTVLRAILLSTGLSAGAWTEPAQAAVLLSEDFEVTPGPISTTAGGITTGQTGYDLQARGWSTTYCASLPCTSDIVTMTGHAGTSTNVLRMTYATANCIAGPPPTGNICDDSTNSDIIRGFSAQTEIYDRYWVRYEPVDRSQPWNFIDPLNPSMKQHEYNVAGAPEMILEFLYLGDMTNNIGWINSHGDFGQELCPFYNVLDVACANPANKTQVPMTVDQWYCVETHVKLNTPGTTGTTAQDGIIEMWVNGTLTTQYTTAGMAWTTEPKTPLTSLMIYRQGAINLYRYEDDVVVATTRVGCGSMPPNDTTPPGAPRGVQVL